MDLVTRDTLKHASKSVAFGAIDTIPFGGVVTRLLEDFFPEVFDSRKKEFLKMLDERFIGFEKEFIDKVSKDDSYAFFITKVLKKINEEHNKEKLEYYANLISNTFKVNDIELDKQSMFVNFLSDLTSRHILLLSIFSSPKESLEKSGKTLNVYMGGISSLFELLVDDYNENLQFYQNVVSDLHSKHLTSIKDLGTTMSKDGILTKRSTVFGDEFLKFILKPF